MGTNQFWRCLQGEELVGIRMENATPWGIIDALRLACLDYVVSVEHFGLRSSLFFGKDWWPLHYQYDYDYINTARQLPVQDHADTVAKIKEKVAKRAEILAARAKTSNYTDYAHASEQITNAQNTVDETQNLEPIYRRRPFLQVHVCHSGTNLIAAEIEATAEGWARSVQATGTYAGTLESTQVETSLVQYLDSDIYPQFQNMKLVTSGLYSTQSMRQREVAGANVLNVAQLFMSTNVLNNYAVGVLHDEVREMYRGNVYQTGCGFLRPRHAVHIVDQMRQLSGVVEVKEVTHTFGMQGFITTWTPDCVAYAMDMQNATGDNAIEGRELYSASSEYTRIGLETC